MLRKKQVSSEKKLTRTALKNPNKTMEINYISNINNKNNINPLMERKKERKKK